MPDSDAYRKRADWCRQQAANFKVNLDLREGYLTLAQEWETLAKRADQQRLGTEQDSNA
jgi:hypothetical protein